jgi:hypothetical protein
MNNNDPKMQRMMRNAAILFGVFLLGLIPPLVRTMQLKKELAETQRTLEMGSTRDLASLAYLEASRNNFGVAAGHASRLYERLAQVAQTGQEPARAVAQDAMGRRDSVMGLLATADASARNELQELTLRLLSTSEMEMQARARAE